jgi:hypothetical protein
MDRTSFVARYLESGEELNDELASSYRYFSNEDQKKIRESIVFIRFMKASGFQVKPQNHWNEDPRECLPAGNAINTGF